MLLASSFWTPHAVGLALICVGFGIIACAQALGWLGPDDGGCDVGDSDDGGE